MVERDHLSLTLSLNIPSSTSTPASSIHNSTISGVSGKKSEIELNAEDVDRDCSSGNSDEEMLILLNT